MKKGILVFSLGFTLMAQASFISLPPQPYSSYSAEKLRFKTGIEYATALVNATGVFVSDPMVQAVYQKVKTLLPTQGLFSEYSDPMMFSAGTLASIFCQRGVQNAQNLPENYRVLYKGIDLSLDVQSIPVESWEQTVVQFHDFFLGRMPTAEEIKVWDSVLIEAQKIAKAGDSEELSTFLASSCALMGTSMEFLLR